MQQKITLDSIITKEVSRRSKFQKIYENEASHFVLGTYKANVFNIKSYLTDKQEKDEYLYLTVNLLSLMANTTADYLIGDGIEVSIDNEQAQKKWSEIAHANNFDQLVYNIALMNGIYGYAILRARKDQDQEIVLEEIPYDYYYPQVEGLFLGEEPRVIYLISKVNETVNTQVQSKAKIQSYTKLDNGKRLIEYGLFKVSLDGSQIANNFTTAFGASIANLGNIGPIPSIDGVNLGPSGNYSVLNSSAKLILSLLMLLGRVGVLSLLLMFMSYKAQQKLGHKIESVQYDEHNKDEVIHLRT